MNNLRRLSHYEVNGILSGNVDCALRHMDKMEGRGSVA